MTQLKAIAKYIKTNVATTGGAAGLVYNLVGGTSSYQYGIIDWPAQMRYGYTFNNNGARTIHNAEAVGAWRATAKVARALGKPEDAATVRRLGGRARRDDEREADPPRRAVHRRPEHGGRQPADQQHRPARADVPARLRHRARGEPGGAAGQDHRPGHEPGPDDVAHAAEGAGRQRPLRPGRQAADGQNADGPARTLAQQGTFMWEQWNPGCATTWPCNPTNNESMSHGWGSWGIVDMVESLLGIQVTSPGAATVKIAPPAIGSGPPA